MNHLNDCASFAEDLSHFVLGELPDERRPALEQHLVACAACRAERDLLSRSVDLVKHEGGTEAPNPELSPARRANLLEQAAVGSGGRPRSWLTIERFAAAAALVIGGSIAWSWLARHFEKNAEMACEKTAARGEESAVADSGGVSLRYSGPADAIPPQSGGAPTDFALQPTPLPSEATPELSELGYPAGDPAAPDLLDDVQLLERNTMTEEELAAATGASGYARLSAKAVQGEAAPPQNPAAPESEGLPIDAAGGTALGAGGSGGGGAAEPAQKPSTFVVRKLGTGLRKSAAAGKAAPATGSSRGLQSPPPTQTLDAATLSRLEALGYLGSDDDAQDGASSTLSSRQQIGNYVYSQETATALAQLLAAANAPSDLLALQPQLAAAFQFDPNTPATREEAEAGEKRAADLVRDFLDQLAPRQGETPRDMFFRYFGDHAFVSTRYDAKSTFGMDVDTASYSLVRAYLTQGNLPPKAAVRTEEFVNAFRHSFAPPTADSTDVFALHTELAPSPFGEGKVLLQVGLKAREIAKEARRPAALTFVIDTSGSMEEGGRLELVKAALHLLVEQLDERDTLGIVRFSNDGRRVLDPTNAANRARIFAALDGLRPDGSTNAGEGLRLGYDMALEQLKGNGENRVIFCSDGVANTGVTDPEAIVRRIRECKARSLYLNCIGVGMNNHNDALMEQLADEGDGACDYVDRIDEAKKIFVEKLTGTLTTVAKNAKIQVEFDPASVVRFRQLGYENRALAHRDFRDDRVDAGEVGAGREVVALYELELRRDAAGPLATVRCRYEEPRSATVHEQAREVFVAEMEAKVQESTPRFRLAAAVAEFAEILRQSIHARDGSLADVLRFAEPLVAELPGDPDVPEFVALVQQAARLPDLLPRRTDLARAIDEIKRSRCMQEELRSAQREREGESARDQANDDLMRQLEEQNRKLEEALRDALERAARGS